MPSPWLISTHPQHTQVSIAGQHPPSKHPCFHFWPARAHVSIAGQHPPSKHTCLHLWPASTHQGHCYASPGCGLSTSSTPNLVILQICRGRRGFLIVIYTMNQEPQDDEKTNKQKKKRPEQTRMRVVLKSPPRMN